MDKPNILILAVLIFLVVQPTTNSQWVPRPLAPHPLCASELAIANHACAFLPYDPGHTPSPSPPPPPSPPSLAQQNDSHEHELVQEHEHRHRHGHSHRRHKHRATPLERDCCRWLEAIDSECVCDLLVHLPAFLSGPVHQYTVVVKDACNVTYNCGSRMRA